MPAHWFDSKRGLATGLCVSGAGVGGLALAAVTQTMIDQVGFRWALRYLGIGGGAVCFICAFFLPARIVPADQLDIFAAIRRFRRRRNSIAAAPTGPAKPRPPLVDFGMFKDGKFVMLFLVGFFAFWFMNVPFQFAPSFATSVVGTTPGTASVVLGIMNGCSSAGRIVLGAVSVSSYYLPA